jgi:hypothetical protein
VVGVVLSNKALIPHIQDSYVSTSLSIVDHAYLAFTLSSSLLPFSPSPLRPSDVYHIIVILTTPMLIFVTSQFLTYCKSPVSTSCETPRET